MATLLILMLALSICVAKTKTPDTNEQGMSSRKVQKAIIRIIKVLRFHPGMLTEEKIKSTCKAQSIYILNNYMYLHLNDVYFKMIILIRYTLVSIKFILIKFYIYIYIYSYI